MVHTLISAPKMGAASWHPAWSTKQIPGKQGLLNDTQSQITSKTDDACANSSGLYANKPHSTSMDILATSRERFHFHFWDRASVSSPGWPGTH